MALFNCNRGIALRRVLVAILAALCCTGTAFGKSAAMPFEITPVVGYRFGGAFKNNDVTTTRVELEDAPSFGLILNLREDMNTQWELMYAYQPTKLDIDALPAAVPTTLVGAAGSDIDVHHLQIGGTYIGDGDWAQPYMAATVGLAHFDPEFGAFDDDTYFAFSIAGGYRLFAKSRVGLRLEGRVYGTVIDSDSNIFCVSGAGDSRCLIEVRSEVLWQWDLMLGATFRF